MKMHYSRVYSANPVDNVDLNVKSFDKNSMPRSGNVMVCKEDVMSGKTREFDAQIQAPAEGGGVAIS